jgi:hypothetical protein
MPKSHCSCDKSCASATACGVATTISGDLVTSTASASACSQVSYSDALSLATDLADKLAKESAQHDANVIGQTLTIVNSRSLIPSRDNITVGSEQMPYSQMHLIDGFAQNSISIGNEAILTSSSDNSNRLFTNGDEIYTASNQQGATINPLGTYYGYGALGNYPPSTEQQPNMLKFASSGATPVSDTGNTAFGTNALSDNTDGYYNSALGYNALAANTAGSNNSALGTGSLEANTTGSKNSALGAGSLVANTTGSKNSALGAGSLAANTTGSNNTAVGYSSLKSIAVGNRNTAVGFNSFTQLQDDSSNNTGIGYNAQPSTTNVSNEITLGDNYISVLRCNAPLTNLSDQRDKKNIENLESSLEFIQKLKPVRFNWNMRDGGKVDIPEIGFIAQDLQQVQKDTGITIPNLVYESNPEKLEASYGTLLPLLVKSIQELSQDNKRLNIQIQELTTLVQEMQNNK